MAECRASRAENPLLKYGLYHAACVITHAFIEDEVALNGGGLLHVFWNDCGNVEKTPNATIRYRLLGRQVIINLYNQ